MSSSKLGKSISEVEVVDISSHGLWLLVEEEEYFLPYEHFPWFKHAPISSVFHVVQESAEHLRWPELDVDLSLDSFRHPERYPLKYR